MTTAARLGHQERLVLAEWCTALVGGVTLTPADQRLADQLRSGGQLVVEELRAGVRIEARSWVGLVRFDGFTVRVQPKLSGDVLGVAQMLAFTGGIGPLDRRRDEQPLLVGQVADLFELLAYLLADAVQAIVRQGLLADYAGHEATLPFLRGRLDASTQLRQHFGRVDRIACRFEELEHDTVDNQLLAAAVRVAVRRLPEGALRRRLRFLAGVLDEICDPSSLDPRLGPSSIAYDRKNDYYRGAHTLSWLILEGAGVQDILAERGQVNSFAFLLDMNTLFERFLHALIRRLLPARDFDVEAQESNHSVLWDGLTGEPYRSIRPDVIVRRRDDRRALAVDAKYKSYDAVDPSSPDIYQGLVYAQAYDGGAPTTVGGRIVRRAMLVYPASRPELRTRRIFLRGPGATSEAELCVCGLPVTATLTALRSGTSEGLSEFRELLTVGTGNPSIS